MRLDKFLAHAQVGTRSEVKKLVRSRHITVNGEIVRKSDIDIDLTHDIVCVDGEEILFEEHLYIMLHKPAGYLSATSDPIQETVMDLFEPPLPNDYFPVGRLDKDTTGLLLICNDGKLAHQLLSPKHHVDKTYLVTVKEILTDEQAEGLTQDMILDGEEAVSGAKIERLSDVSFHMTIQEGKFHQVKRMVAYVGNEVIALKRISMGSLQLDESLQEGECRLLTEEELEEVKNCG